jgi:cytoskeletal protein CcmA (bactofilin family)
MATNIIKIKRTTGTTAPSSLNAGELAFSGGAGTQGNMGQRLFVGDPANSNAVTVIGGNYFAKLMDHVHGTTTASSGLIVDSNKSATEIRTPALYLGTSGSDTLVTATAAELNALDGITSTFTELNYLDGTSLGTVVASLAVAVDSNKDITGFRNITATGAITGATLVMSGNVDFNGDIDIDGTSNLDNTDIDGSLTVDGAVDINATTFDIDATDDIDIDTSDTTGGIAIGTATSGVPITIGHTTSETAIRDNLTVSGNTTVTGNLTVSGTTTTVNSTTVSIADPIFELGTSGSDDNLDRGLKMKYNSSGAKFAFIGYDDSDGKFAFIPNATDTSNVFTGAQGTLKANIETGNTGITVGSSVPFSDSSGTLTLTNVDALDATTEATIEAAIDTLSSLTTVGTIGSGTWEGTTVAVDQGGTGITSASSSGYVMVSNGSGFVMQSIDGGTYG